MNVWLGLWLGAALLEGAVLSMSYIWLYKAKVFRWVMVVLALFGSVGSTLLLVQHDWRVWLLPGFISLYRWVNIYRVAAWRVPANRLYRTTNNSFVWLIGLQLVVAVVLYVSRRMGYETLLAIIAALQVLVAAVLLRSTINTWRHTRMPSAVPPLTNAELPSVSVLIPARNESEELAVCLESLVASDYPKLEIIVLDDCSTSKRTPEIIRQFAKQGVQFIHGREPDTRWLAKNAACQTLAAKASGEVLVFGCADVVFETDTLRRLVEVMLAKNRDMMSVMPSRGLNEYRTINILQAMRYYWELAFPRRLFKRPPVLSSLWLIKNKTLTQYGGFESAMRAVSPEATFAKKAVVTDRYIFVRGDEKTLRLSSVKTTSEQFATSARVRYPQLHRRLELVCLVTLFELLFFIGPFVGLLFSLRTSRPLAYAVAWSVACLFLSATYYVSSVLTRLSEPFVGIVMPVAAYVMDLVVLHTSMFRYEFSDVLWRGRNICYQVMHVVPKKT
jgi:chlorobactene glucosyltransferase